MKINGNSAQYGGGSIKPRPDLATAVAPVKEAVAAFAPMPSGNQCIAVEAL